MEKLTFLGATGTETNTLRLAGGPPASPERSRWRAGTPIFVVSRQ